MSDNDTDHKKLYAVFRNGFRVSNSEYESESFAQPELDYWKNIISRYPDGSKLEIRHVYVRNRD
jgi:hypothetical protein